MSIINHLVVTYFEDWLAMNRAICSAINMIKKLGLLDFHQTLRLLLFVAEIEGYSVPYFDRIIVSEALYR